MIFSDLSFSVTGFDSESNKHPHTAHAHTHTLHYLVPTGGQQRFRCLSAASQKKTMLALFAAHLSTLSLLGKHHFSSIHASPIDTHVY